MIAMIQDYLTKINCHNWTNDKLKSSLILAVYVNCGLMEFSRSMGTELSIDINAIIDDLIKVDNV
ncbi:MAG: hypothetical protein ACKPFA_30815 [Dolichospermum sp.]